MALDKSTIESLVKDNLFLVFGGTSSRERLAQLGKLWAPSGSILFTDPDFSKTTYEEVDAFVGNLQESKQGWLFTGIGMFAQINLPRSQWSKKSRELTGRPGEVQILKTEGDLAVARLKWGYGPGSQPEDFKVTGEDVVTIVKGKIERLYTFLD